MGSFRVTAPTIVSSLTPSGRSNGSSTTGWYNPGLGLNDDASLLAGVIASSFSASKTNCYFNRNTGNKTATIVLIFDSTTIFTLDGTPYTYATLPAGFGIDSLEVFVQFASGACGNQVSFSYDFLGQTRTQANGVASTFAPDVVYGSMSFASFIAGIMTFTAVIDTTACGAGSNLDQTFTIHQLDMSGTYTITPVYTKGYPWTLQTTDSTTGDPLKVTPNSSIITIKGAVTHAIPGGPYSNPLSIPAPAPTAPPINPPINASDFGMLNITSIDVIYSGITINVLAADFITWTDILIEFLLPDLPPDDAKYIELVAHGTPATEFDGSFYLGSLLTIYYTNPSGIYQLVTDKLTDSLYLRDGSGSTIEVAIPNPTFKTGYIGG